MFTTAARLPSRRKDEIMLVEFVSMIWAASRLRTKTQALAKGSIQELSYYKNDREEIMELSDERSRTGSYRLAG